MITFCFFFPLSLRSLSHGDCLGYKWERGKETLPRRFLELKNSRKFCQRNEEKKGKSESGNRDRKRRVEAHFLTRLSWRRLGPETSAGPETEGGS